MPPQRGDYWHLAFGYIQAPAIPSYQGSLDVLQKQRRINPIPAIVENDYQNWKISSVKGCPRTGLEITSFWCFVVFALSIQVAFLAVAPAKLQNDIAEGRLEMMVNFNRCRINAR
jgi:hypothetical protein